MNADNKNHAERLIYLAGLGCVGPLETMLDASCPVIKSTFKTILLKFVKSVRFIR